MATPIKKSGEDMKSVGLSKRARVIKMKNAAINSPSTTKLAQAHKQAKNIMQGLKEAEQIRVGNLPSTTFEDHFGNL